MDNEIKGNKSEQRSYSKGKRIGQRNNGETDWTKKSKRRRSIGQGHEWKQDWWTKIKKEIGLDKNIFLKGKRVGQRNQTKGQRNERKKDQNKI